MMILIAREASHIEYGDFELDLKKLKEKRTRHFTLLDGSHKAWFPIDGKCHDHDT